MPVAVGEPRHVILVPELVDRRVVGVVVVDSVTEAEFVDLSSVLNLAIIAAFLRRGLGAKSETLAVVAPAGLVIGDEDLRHAKSGVLLPQRVVSLTIGRAVRTPDAFAGHVHPGRRRVGDVGQYFLELRGHGKEDPFEAVVAATVGFEQVASAAVVGLTGC